MCAPAAIPYVLMAIGTAYSMHAESQASKYNAQVDMNNAALSKQQAANANAAGSYAADQSRIRTNLERGQQIAAFAANNVDVQTGTAADVLGDTAMFGEIDQRQARTNAAQRAYGFQVQGLSDLGNAQYARWQGRTQQMGTLLQGASGMAGMASRAGYFSGGGGSSFSGGNTLMTGGPYYGPGSTGAGMFGFRP